VKIFDWLYDKMTRDFDMRVTEAPAIRTHPPTAPGKTLRDDHMRQLSERFTHHAPTPQQIKKYGSLRTRAKELAFLIDELCPHSEERDYALHYLDAVVMNANAAIARHGDEQ
jgi:hypothetical protein